MLKLKLQYFGHLMHLKRPWCWERLKAGEGANRGWDGWMASLTQWAWVWVNSGSWWWTGRPGVLWFMKSQRVGHDRATGLDWTELKHLSWAISPHPSLVSSYHSYAGTRFVSHKCIHRVSKSPVSMGSQRVRNNLATELNWTDKHTTRSQN